MPVHFFCEVFCISIGIVIRCFSFGKLPVHQQNQLWLTWTHRVFNTWFTRPSFRTTLLKAYASHTCSWMFIGCLLRDLRETGRRLTQEREWVKGCSPSRMQFTLETFCTFFYHFPLRLFVLSPLQNLTLCCFVVSLWGRKYRPSSDAGLVLYRPTICQLLCLFVYKIHICDWRVWLLGHPSYQCAG
jgi:hypothetical protein